jgi:hypothetical protein
LIFGIAGNQVRFCKVKSLVGDPGHDADLLEEGGS